MSLQLNIGDILKLLSHRYPMLLVDKVISLDSGQHIKALKNVSYNEPYFIGHFPNNPVMPGVLIQEAMVQAGAILITEYLGRHDQLIYLQSIDKTKFLKPVTPGDVLELDIDLLAHRNNLWRFRAKAQTNEQIVANSEFYAATPESTY